MLPVGFQVENVVKNVNRTGDDAEQPKPGQRAQEVGQAEEFAVENQRGEDEGILRPLARSHGFQEGA